MSKTRGKCALASIISAICFQSAVDLNMLNGVGESVDCYPDESG